MEFKLREYQDSDYDKFWEINKMCFKPYVDEYYGGWNDDDQLVRFNKALERRKLSLKFKTILDNSDEIVGFCNFDEEKKNIFADYAVLVPKARGNGFGTWFLNTIIDYSKKVDKPIELQVFKNNPAQKLYERCGFVKYDENETHIKMRFCNID